MAFYNEKDSANPFGYDEDILALVDQPVQYDATGRMISSTIPVPKRKPENVPIPKRKPEVISPTKKGNELLDFIGKLESSDNYNVIVGGEEKPLTSMKFKEVRQLQKERNQKNMGTAVGRYQIIDDKMDDLVRWMGISDNDVFDKNLQDKMARQLLEKREFEDYKSGKISTKKFIRNLSKEWASFPKDESNESYYKGLGNNKALVDYDTVKELLEKK